MLNYPIVAEIFFNYLSPLIKLDVLFMLRH